ncbi:hypothetical protein COT44_04340 [Candidatus Shapirobacteria bacterium CG08_land_8_20_14_0_20_39_18]|uniref:Sortase n=1 Tax=Candidatus Shapirobacteria bacterium CG08_land_8_20_14_0_20_39_18 TaxID=1974883 RepID=A0A2M6XC86_9BACT|nr:MAG: hypothetical protein COT44_04340 [Candidatus Shapirobacteria bacterium CG08_land_8_20_14_0_20_39_18]PIY66372.1 MAG: hypothetical protein COY91_00325 [Candidatus Shapirobacteria bacterium CG_4_10_14_0_8_um_filter_39_15]PJE68050.1 MAG: hypothetical protein COU94_03795 [Candidatus Shapirobacteria bacterium CG10_big_fil_rev_8_21_14_0_10_38_8]
MPYRYVKKYPKPIRHHRQIRISKFLSLFFVFLGTGLILSALFPILSYQFFVSPQVTGLLNPAVSSIVLGQSSTLDTTQISNWFVNAPKLPPLPSKITHYSLSIPKLKIDQAVVKIGGSDLKKSLIHYQGTAFPGQLGTTVIFGHSSLPQLFMSQNYLTIFTYLPKMTKGDEILIEFDSILYKYLVEEVTEVTPDDVSIMEQRYDDSYLALVTCVPPGTTINRLVVRAKITKI